MRFDLGFQIFPIKAWNGIDGETPTITQIFMCHTV